MRVAYIPPSGQICPYDGTDLVVSKSKNASESAYPHICPTCKRMFGPYNDAGFLPLVRNVVTQVRRAEEHAVRVPIREIVGRVVRFFGGSISKGVQNFIAGVVQSLLYALVLLALVGFGWIRWPGQ